MPAGDLPDVVLGLVLPPGAPAALGGRFADDVRAGLASRHPGVRWDVRAVADPLAEPPADDGELVAAARRLLLASGWDLAVGLTDLPLRAGRRPVVAHASPVHGIALLSVPALGAVSLRRRAREHVVRLVEQVLGESGLDGEDAESADRLARRLRELGDETDAGTDVVRFTARVLTGNLRLLAGMIRANRPWRLAARLSRALAAALAAGVFAIVTADIWALADAMGPVRLGVVAVGSVAAIATSLIAGAGLWERPRGARAREQVVLFNLATTATVVLGVLTLYGALFVLSLLAGLLLLVPGVLAAGLGHPVTLGDYAELAWLTTSLATVGGALGAGLESEDAVHEAAYTYRSSEAAGPGEGAAGEPGTGPGAAGGGGATRSA